MIGAPKADLAQVVESGFTAVERIAAVCVADGDVQGAVAVQIADRD